MDDLTRRAALALAATAGGVGAAASDEPAKPIELPKPADPAKPSAAPDPGDKDRVKACGLTEAEADCWEAVAAAAGKFFGLPKMHPMDEHEVAHAIHVIQFKLLARPTYRRYLELTRAQKK